MSNRILIFSDVRSPRMDYVLDLIFKQLLGLEFELTGQAIEAHVIYGRESKGYTGIFIPQTHDLLARQGFAPVKVSHRHSGARAEYFILEDAQPGVWGFDLFSALFYLVTRYEEYAGFTPDSHDRFPPGASILVRTGSLEFPLVNLWVKALRNELAERFPELEFNEPPFRFISTIDIDSTWQFRNKGLVWGTMGFFKDLLNGNFREMADRLQSVTGMKHDAFDVFAEINEWHRNFGTEVIYFWLLGDHSQYDKSIPWTNREQAGLIRELDRNFRVGIHPSYDSLDKPELLDKESGRFRQITGHPALISRQHFLRHRFPETPRDLLAHGIREDHTLGYTSHYGFRGGIASPVKFYDLEKDCAEDLWMYPFCSMDITPLHYEGLTPEQAIEKNEALLKRVRDVNGTFISLWHNESLSGALRWKGRWKDVYRELIRSAAR